MALLAATAGGPRRVPNRGPETSHVLLAGGSASNTIHIWLTPDGRSYVIDSIVPLEVGGDSLHQPRRRSRTSCVCRRPAIAGFEVNAGGGDDTVTVSQERDDPGDDPRRRRATTP